MKEEPPPSVLSKLTLIGRMLLLAHLMLFIGGTALYVCGVITQLPTGSYPVLMFAIPVGLGCFFLFLALAWALERIGIEVYKR